MPSKSKKSKPKPKSVPSAPTSSRSSSKAREPLPKPSTQQTQPLTIKVPSASISQRLSRKPRTKTTMRSMTVKSAELVRDKIFTLLDNKSKLAARLVSRRWRNLVDHNLSFRILLNEDTYDQVEKFVRKRKVGEFLVGFFSQPYPDPGWKFTNVGALNILPDYRYHIFYEDINATGGHASVKPTLAMVMMPEAKLEKLFREFCTVNRLVLSSTALADIKQNSFLKGLEFPNLNVLDISVERTHGFEAVTDIFSNTFPNLGKLAIQINNDDDMTLYAEIYEFVSRHSSTLKDLKRVYIDRRGKKGVHRGNNAMIAAAEANNNENSKDSEGVESTTVSQCTLIQNLYRDHKLEAVEYAEVLKNLTDHKLTTLEICSLTSEGRGRKNMELQLFRAQSYLQSLHLTNIRPENMPVWRTLPAVLKRCGPTLQSIILDGCFCDAASSDPPGPFWCRWVENCKNLQKLEILVCGIRVVDIHRIPKDKLTVLCLGHNVSQRQMKAAMDLFTELEQVSFPQNFVTDPESPKAFSLHQFKRALQLPKLQRLYISSGSCKVKLIRRFAAWLLGIVENSKEKERRGDMEFIIDRDLFVFDQTQSSKK